ncbi:GIY-YIG nuclease family protein [Candidatus Uhrbacteria bacterium]|nr:GIY-YIG nuclease family protein [Candidatus Uhrbacteria bacterium]
MHHVYIIRSASNPARIYKGSTEDIVQRLAKHNKGDVTHTRNGRPWVIVYSASFETKKLAIDFERYLKTASGIAFMRKRLTKMPR